MFKLVQGAINQSSEKFDKEKEQVMNDANTNTLESLNIQCLSSQEEVDLVFLIDTTLSMKSVMENVKNFAKKIISQYSTLISTKLQVGLVMYKDHSENEVSQVILNLTPKITDAIGAINRLKASGGQDIPEAVIDGLNDAVNSVSWRSSSEKYLYHILDSPPHGSKFSQFDDNNIYGCPCDINYRSVLTDLQEKKIKYSIIKLSSDIECMINYFAEWCDIQIFSPKIDVLVGSSVSQYI